MLRHFPINLFDPHLTLLGNITLLCSPNIQFILQLMKGVSFTYIHSHFFFLSSQHMIIVWKTDHQDWHHYDHTNAHHSFLEQSLLPGATPPPLKCRKSAFQGQSILSMRHHALVSPWTHPKVILQSSSTPGMWGASASHQEHRGPPHNLPQHLCKGPEPAWASVW